jgi:peptide-methionine (R)-S-oxide reductase
MCSRSRRTVKFRLSYHDRGCESVRLLTSHGGLWRYTNEMNLSRLAALSALAAWTLLPAAASALTDEEWRKRLSPQAYDVLRQHGTESPGSSPLDAESRKGTYHCAGCDLALFSSTTKYHSGTGWPSFWAALPRAVATANDNTLGMARTEVHCSRCQGHLGHLFDDGPAPTGERYCMNGVALSFAPS